MQRRECFAHSNVARDRELRVCVCVARLVVDVSSALDAPARHPSNIDSIKVFEFMGHEAKSKLGKFYQPHNSQLLHVLNNEPKVTTSPSVKGLGIQLWSS